MVRVDTGADVNCMNEKTFNELFSEVQLSVCPHKIQNFRNSIADISILGQFHTYLEFRGEKYLNTFIVTNANDCPNLLSYGTTFRMAVLLPNYSEENVVKGDNVPNFNKLNTNNGTSCGTSDGTSNIFQILQDLQQRQRAVQYQYNFYIVPTMHTVPEMETSFMTTTSSTPAMTAKQVDPVYTHKYFMEWTSSTLHTCTQATEAGLQTREIVSLEKSQAPTQWKDFCEQTPIDKARHSVTLFWLL